MESAAQQRTVTSGMNGDALKVRGLFMNEPASRHRSTNIHLGALRLLHRQTHRYMGRTILFIYSFILFFYTIILLIKPHRDIHVANENGGGLFKKLYRGVI